MINLAILGIGSIASGVAPTLAAVPEINCYAAASRSQAKADDFARQFGFTHAYGSYESMLEDPNVDLVYIATPHSHHCEWMLRCMEKGKGVLCEKAFTTTGEEARQVQAYAEAHHVFAAEAIWPRYMPSRRIIQDTIESGIIGEVKTLTANLFYNVGHRERLWKPELAGGALLDVGVYGLNFALMHFGTEVEAVEASAQMTESGVDAMDSITLFYKNGRTAVITAGMFARSDRHGIFFGDKGYIVVNNINNPQDICVYDDQDHLLQKTVFPVQISGYEYEFQECARLLEAGKKESDSMPLSESVIMMDMMDRIRSVWKTH